MVSKARDVHRSFPRDDLICGSRRQSNDHQKDRWTFRCHESHREGVYALRHAGACRRDQPHLMRSFGRIALLKKDISHLWKMSLTYKIICVAYLLITCCLSCDPKQFSANPTTSQHQYLSQFRPKTK